MIGHDDLRIRPGRIRDRGPSTGRPKSFVGQVMRAARKAGHTGRGFGRAAGATRRSAFGRGRRAALALSLKSPGRRVAIMSRVVRHRGSRFRSAPLSKHVAYLKREGVTRDGADARMFDARSDDADSKAFAERCEDDRHHFRFTVSPEDATQMADLRAFTRELMKDAEGDLGTPLDWIAVDHWNTDNPHIHVLVRGRADDGQDLVISRDYISRGFRARAAERVTLELGPRSEQEIRSALEKEVGAERWTGLDRALCNVADEGAGVADLRPGAQGEDPELRLLMVGRVAKLERLGLAEQVAPGCWTLKSVSRRRCASSPSAATLSKPCIAPCPARAVSRISPASLCMATTRLSLCLAGLSRAVCMTSSRVRPTPLWKVSTAGRITSVSPTWR